VPKGVKRLLEDEEKDKVQKEREKARVRRLAASTESIAARAKRGRVAQSNPSIATRLSGKRSRGTGSGSAYEGDAMSHSGTAADNSNSSSSSSSSSSSRSSKRAGGSTTAGGRPTKRVKIKTETDQEATSVFRRVSSSSAVSDNKGKGGRCIQDSVTEWTRLREMLVQNLKVASMSSAYSAFHSAFLSPPRPPLLDRMYLASHLVSHLFVLTSFAC
jgi:hypothetical protein